ncbi:MAG: T9SS type A sorting domain-containing protein [Bacteroidetes bacterium]|nr:T9SS type A sorting domain-containing protein [Bacteroidota bacterium]
MSKWIITQSITFVLYINCYSQPLSGNYYIGGNAHDFQTITEAVATIAANGVNGQVIFHINPGVYSEQITIGSIAGVSSVSTITFKSSTLVLGDVTIKYKPSSSPWHVVSLSNCSYINFENIEFTNENLAGSSTNYGLVLRMESTNNISLQYCRFNGKINPIDQSEYNDLIFSQSGSNNNLTISNCIFNDGKSSIALLSNGRYSTNVNINENHFYYSYGSSIHILNTISTNISKNYIVNSGSLMGKNGLLIAYSYSPINITGNTIYGSNEYELYINRCNILTGEINVINNFITNNYGIAAILSVYCSAINLFHNSIYSFGGHAALMMYCSPDNNCVIKNNIFKSNGNGVYNIQTPVLPKSADNNVFDLELNARIGFIGGRGYIDSLSAWVQNTSLDSVSRDKNVVYRNIDDLHLDSVSIGDLSLKGIPLGIGSDIDGEARNLSAPYVGADENVQFPLPVELRTFRAEIRSHKIFLFWDTVMEINNYGFEIEVYVRNGWERIGFVEGSGNTNIAREYRYVYNPHESGEFHFRLKQIDRDGAFTYSNIVQVKYIHSVSTAILKTCYPNPFNPLTTISFEVEHPSFVKLKIFSAIGQYSGTLVQEYLKPGSYNKTWDASGLPSGVYFCQLQVGDFVETKRMLLLK